MDINKMEFQWRLNWWYRPTQLDGFELSVADYYECFCDWKTSMELNLCPAHEADYVDAFIQNLRCDIRSRLESKGRLSRRLSDAFYYATIEEFFISFEKAFKKFETLKPFDQLPSPVLEDSHTAAIAENTRSVEMEVDKSDAKDMIQEIDCDKTPSCDSAYDSKFELDEISLSWKENSGYNDADVLFDEISHPKSEHSDELQEAEDVGDVEGVDLVAQIEVDPELIVLPISACKVFNNCSQPDSIAVAGSNSMLRQCVSFPVIVMADLRLNCMVKLLVPKEKDAVPIIKCLMNSFYVKNENALILIENLVMFYIDPGGSQQSFFLVANKDENKFGAVEEQTSWMKMRCSQLGEMVVFMFDPGIISWHLMGSAYISSSEMPNNSVIKWVDKVLLCTFDPGGCCISLVELGTVNTSHLNVELGIELYKAWQSENFCAWCSINSGASLSWSDVWTCSTFYNVDWGSWGTISLTACPYAGVYWSKLALLNCGIILLLGSTNHWSAMALVTTECWLRIIASGSWYHMRYLNSQFNELSFSAKRLNSQAAQQLLEKTLSILLSIVCWLGLVEYTVNTKWFEDFWFSEMPTIVFDPGGDYRHCMDFDSIDTHRMKRGEKLSGVIMLYNGMLIHFVAKLKDFILGKGHDIYMAAWIHSWILSCASVNLREMSIHLNVESGVEWLVFLFDPGGCVSKSSIRLSRTRIMVSAVFRNDGLAFDDMAKQPLAQFSQASIVFLKWHCYIFIIVVEHFVWDPGTTLVGVPFTSLRTMMLLRGMEEYNSHGYGRIVVHNGNHKVLKTSSAFRSFQRLHSIFGTRKRQCKEAQVENVKQQVVIIALKTQVTSNKLTFILILKKAEAIWDQNGDVVILHFNRHVFVLLRSFGARKELLSLCRSLSFADFIFIFVAIKIDRCVFHIVSLRTRIFSRGR